MDSKLYIKDNRPYFCSMDGRDCDEGKCEKGCAVFLLDVVRAKEPVRRKLYEVRAEFKDTGKNFNGFYTYAEAMRLWDRGSVVGTFVRGAQVGDRLDFAMGPTHIKVEVVEVAEAAK